MAEPGNTALWRLLREAPVSIAGGQGRRDAAELLERLSTASPNWADLDEMIARPVVGDVLAGLFDGSSYLSSLIIRDDVRLIRILSAPPKESFDAARDVMRGACQAAASMADVKIALRRFKAEAALMLAIADLGGALDVMTITRLVTEIADRTLSEAVRFLFRQASARKHWVPKDAEAPEAGSGYIVLAMGKQGAFELNYSSDIDLIVFFDRTCAGQVDGFELQTFFVRLTRDLLQLMEERTVDGYVFRTDLRLRPDAGATQIALSTDAAHDYYESVGQNWERAAMIKARAVAGDIEAGRAFLYELGPFIWRRNLDFAAIADIHAMKRQIHATRGFGTIAVAGHNLKVGRGGIREIEFFAQTQQLIAGGRQPALREPATLGALAALEKYEWISAQVRAELDRSYRYLRRLEHRLQMVGDEQTHTLPNDAHRLERFARFAGYGNTGALAAELTDVLETVQRCYGELFEDVPELTRAGRNMVFAGSTDDPATLEALAELGYARPSQAIEAVRSWHHGRTKAVRSPRARELLTDVQPLLIEALAETADADSALTSFDRFLSALPAGVQLFSLLKANPGLLRVIADIMGTAPRLARILSRRPRLFDAVLDPRILADIASVDDLDRLIEGEFASARALSGADALPDILDRARIIGGEQAFLIGIRVLTQTIGAADAGGAYATVAERLVAGLMTETLRDLEALHGKVPRGRAVVMAMGKLGGREMTATSDLDLIVVYDFDAEGGFSSGPKPLAPTLYYARLTQRLIAALSAQTPEGSLYEVDFRLRPSGQKGPVATQFKGFLPYQLDEAWTWEHMALTRARVVAGDVGLAADLNAAIRQVLSLERDRGKIAADVGDMRERIYKDKGTTNIWDMKQVRGGLVDLEFIVQYLQLVYGASHPGVFHQTTISALDRLRSAGVLSVAEAQRLIGAGHLLHDLTQIVRLCFDGVFKPESAPDGLKMMLARVGGAETFEALEVRLAAAQGEVHDAFDRLVV